MVLPSLWEKNLSRAVLGPSLIYIIRGRYYVLVTNSTDVARRGSMVKKLSSEKKRSGYEDRGENNTFNNGYIMVQSENSCH